jgi:hypothetical protein
VPSHSLERGKTYRILQDSARELGGFGIVEECGAGQDSRRVNDGHILQDSARELGGFELALLVRRKICTFWSDKKYALFGPTKNMHFLVQRKICTFWSGPPCF